MYIIIGNIISLIGCIIMVLIGLIKDRKSVIKVQTIQMLVFALSNLVLGGISGCIVNVLSAIRNIFCYKEKLNIPIKLIYIVTSILLSLYFCGFTFLGILPVISSVVYTIFMDVKDDKKLKYLNIFSLLFWVVYDVSLQNYVTFCFDIITIISTTIGLYRLNQSAK